jgi:hypothetical protein
MANRDELKQQYVKVIADALVVLDEMSADFWEQGEEHEVETKRLVDQLRGFLKDERRLKGELLTLKEKELQGAAQADLDYLAQLRQKWENEATLMSVIFGASDSPFVFEWAKNGEDWVDKIQGLRETLPLRSKGFVGDLQKYFKRSLEEFEYN